jgi:phosphocarrier protein
MIETCVTISNKLGLHARAAAKFIACASRYASDIKVGHTPDTLVDGKSIMAVMMLAAAKGTVLTLQIDGKDEHSACEALQTLIDNRFDEPQ